MSRASLLRSVYLSVRLSLFRNMTVIFLQNMFFLSSRSWKTKRRNKKRGTQQLFRNSLGDPQCRILRANYATKNQLTMRHCSRRCTEMQYTDVISSVRPHRRFRLGGSSHPLFPLVCSSFAATFAEACGSQKSRLARFSCAKMG